MSRKEYGREGKRQVLKKGREKRAWWLTGRVAREEGEELQGYKETQVEGGEKIKWRSVVCLRAQREGGRSGKQERRGKCEKRNKSEHVHRTAPQEGGAR